MTFTLDLLSEVQQSEKSTRVQDGSVENLPRTDSLSQKSKNIPPQSRSDECKLFYFRCAVSCIISAGICDTIHVSVIFLKQHIFELSRGPSVNQ